MLEPPHSAPARPADPRMASWRSGYAEDCKSLHPGSIPGEASTFPPPSRSFRRHQGVEARPATRDGHGHAPAGSAHPRAVDGQDHESYGQHPDAEDRQEAEDAACDEGPAEHLTAQRRARQAVGPPEIVVRKAAFGGLAASGAGVMGPVMGARCPAFNRTGAEKTHRATIGPWQGRNTCAIRAALTTSVILGSSVVEQPAVNRLVAGSNPARGANSRTPETHPRFGGFACPPPWRRPRAAAREIQPAGVNRAPPQPVTLPCRKRLPSSGSATTSASPTIRP